MDWDKLKVFHVAAEAPRHVTHAERSQRQEDSRCRVAAGEEDLAEDEGRAGPIDEEIIVLQRTANPAGDRSLLRCLGSVRLVCFRGFVQDIGSHFAYSPHRDLLPASQRPMTGVAIKNRRRASHTSKGTSPARLANGRRRGTRLPRPASVVARSKSCAERRAR